MTRCDRLFRFFGGEDSTKRQTAMTEYAAYTAGAEAHGAGGRAICKRFSANARPAALPFRRIVPSYHGTGKVEDASSRFVCVRLVGARARQRAGDFNYFGHHTPLPTAVKHSVLPAEKMLKNHKWP